MLFRSLSGPTTISSTAAVSDSARVGHCHTDSMTISNPGGSQPPTICGYNTGQHMYVTASDQCNQINIDVDTGSTSTTRKWQIKVTQYECGNMMAPEQDCLQYLTASTGKINETTIISALFLFFHRYNCQFQLGHHCLNCCHHSIPSCQPTL